MDRTTIDRRREIEDRAIELGEQRVQLLGQFRKSTAANAMAITALLDRAVELGITVEHFARLVGVRRQSLYRWRADAGSKPEASE
jgi:hypothetical protein